MLRTWNLLIALSFPTRRPQLLQWIARVCPRFFFERPALRLLIGIAAAGFFFVYGGGGILICM